MKKRWYLFIALALLLLVLTACSNPQGDGDGTTNSGATDTPTEEVTQPAIEYTKDTEVFETFGDMKKNAALFKDQIPCTRSTKGFHAANDGGAATYRITATQPEGISEKLANGCFAQLVTEADFVVPEQFGAYGDGKKNDVLAILRAAEYARLNEITLKLPEKEYRTNNPVIVEGINIQSENAKISYYGLAASTPALSVKSNVNIYGKLRIWSIDNFASNSGERCGLLFGNYGSGEGAHNCYVEDVEITGGCENANGILITGDSSNLTFDKVTIPEGTNICRGILLHWGNAADYKAVDPFDQSKGIYPIEGADPTKHPHNVHVKKLICTDIDKNGKFGDAAAFFISAAYDVTVDEIVADKVRSVVMVTGGDCGLEYATAAEQEYGLSNLKFNKITATNVKTNAVLYTTVSSYLGNTDFYGTMEFGEINIDGCSLPFAFVGLKQLKMETVNIKNSYSQVFLFRGHCKDAEINTLNMLEGCKGSAATIEKYNSDPCAENIKFNTINVFDGCGGSNKELVLANAVNGLEIGQVNITNATFSYILSISDECSNVRLGTFNNNASNVTSIFFARSIIPSANNIFFGTATGKTTTLITGASCDVRVDP